MDIKIRGEQEFKLKAVVYVIGSDGKQKLIENYEAIIGDMHVTLEGESKRDRVLAYERLTYKQFKRRYVKHKIYLQGYILG